MAQLPSFLPALFDAFGNQSADVRKVGVLFATRKFLYSPVQSFFSSLSCSFFRHFILQTVVFCLVDIYIVLGKAFLPYLGSLSSTQLRLVTIYANRISQVIGIAFMRMDICAFFSWANVYIHGKQARSGGPLDA
jgi:CLIP-associating protein 1/2